MKTPQAKTFQGDGANSRIGRSLIGLITIAVLPLLLLIIGVGSTVIEQKKVAATSELTNTARALRVAVDRDLLNQLPAMQILATDVSLDNGDQRLFIQRAQRAIDAHRDWRSVSLIDPSNFAIVASTMPLPARQSTSIAARQVEEVARTRKPQVAGAFSAGRVSTAPLIILLAPVVRNDKVPLVIVVAMNTEAMSNVFSEQRLPETWTGAVVDNQMRIAGRSRDAARFVGVRITPSLEGNITATTTGLFTALNQEGATVHTVFDRSPLTGWSVVIGVPDVAFNGPIRQLLMQLAAVGGALIALALVLAAAVARSITRTRGAYERDLRASEERFRRLTSLSSDWYWEQDENLRFTSISSGIQVQQRAVGELLGKTCWELPHFDTDPQLESENKALLAARKPFKDLVIKRMGRDKHFHYAQVSGEPVFDENGKFKGYSGVGSDITERKNAEDSLRKSKNEERERADELATLLDVLPAFTFIANDPDCKSMTSSGSALRVLQLPAGANTSKSAPPGERPQTFRTMKNGRELRPEELPVQLAAATGQPMKNFELTLALADGTTRDIAGDAVPLFNKEGKVRGAIGAFLDITERKLAEEARRASDDQLRAFYDLDLTGLAITSPEKGWIRVNQYLCQMLEYSEEDLRARTWAELTHPEDMAADVEQFNRLLAKEIEGYSLEKRFISHSGKIIPTRLVVRCTRKANGDVDFVTAMVEDITERKRMEEALRVHDSRYRAVVESSSDGFWVVDTEGRLRDVNEAYVHRSGFTRDELLGMHVYDLDAKESKADAAAHIRSIMDKGGDVFESLHRAKDGTLWPVEISVNYRTNESEPMLCFLRDITERKRLEATYLQAQKMEALGTLAGGVAHDFNNALAMIAGNVVLARQDVGPGHPALESLEEIAKASRRSKDLVQQILAFSRRQKLERKPTSLSMVVLESARLLRASLPAKVTLNVECKPDTPAVLADAGQVKQILLNLCSNAAHAVENGQRPGVIEVRLEASTVGEARGDLRPGRYACLAVRDNGSGMDEAVRSHLFEPFFTTKAVGQGTGLGLSVVHGIAQAHEAGIEVDSMLGKGTTFRIYFPAVKIEVPAETESVKSPTRVQGGGKHILFVDDEEGLVRLMQRLLVGQGFRFSGYDDPREALNAVRANPGQFDLVVTDYNMPHISGLELAQAVKAIRADLPIILASGYITEELRAKAPAAGIRELIYKPNTVDDLCDAVARYANAQGGSRGSSDPIDF